MTLKDSRPIALVVDDDPTALMIVARTAETAGFRSIRARDGLQALAILSGGVMPQLIVTDVDMPHIDGLALVRKVRAHEVLRETPVIVFSGSDRPADDGGADVWLAKHQLDRLLGAMRPFHRERTLPMT